MFVWRLMGLMLFVLTVAAEEPIVVGFIEREHYIELVHKQPRGLIIERINKAFADAKIPIVWQRLSPQKQFAELKVRKSRFCAANWFATPERQKFAYISAPVIPTSPYVLVARRDDTRFHEQMSLKQLINSPLRLGLGIGYSLGVELDQLVQDKQLNVAWQRADDAELLNSMLAGHSDYSFLFANEAPALLAGLHKKAELLTTYQVRDMPEVPWSHLLCNFRVGLKTMEKINASLRAQIEN